MSPTGAIAVRGAFFGQGTGNIVNTEFACSGNESRLFDCQKSFDTIFCGHHEDAGVICPSGIIYARVSALVLHCKTFLVFYLNNWYTEALLISVTVSIYVTLTYVVQGYCHRCVTELAGVC